MARNMEASRICLCGRAARNGLRLMLLTPGSRPLYGHRWEEAARDMVGMLRLDAGRAPKSPWLAEITSELNDRSPLFRQAWGVHRVSSTRTPPKRAGWAYAVRA